MALVPALLRTLDSDRVILALPGTTGDAAKDKETTLGVQRVIADQMKEHFGTPPAVNEAACRDAIAFVLSDEDSKPLSSAIISYVIQSM